MTAIPVRQFMDSAELAGVREITAGRFFAVEIHGVRSVVEYHVDSDTLRCKTHRGPEGCTCTFNVRMCGILTHTVSKKMPVVHFDIGQMVRAHEANGTTATAKAAQEQG